MARPSKIPENIHGALLEKAGEGLSTRQLAAWLKTKGVDVTHVAVARLLAKRREERAEVTKAVVRERLAPSVTADVDRLEKHAAQLDHLADSLVDSDPELYLKAVEQLRKITETKLHYAGAGTPDDSLTELAAAQERVRARAARLGQRVDPRPNHPGAGADPS